jgi:hypothetical protein
MKKRKGVLLLIIVAFLAMPMMVSALGLDVSVQAGVGAAMGTTDDDNKSGKLRWAAGGGVALDFYILEISSFEVGISAGADYVNLHYYGIAKNVPTPAPLPLLLTERTSESTYNYLTIPFAIVGMYDLSDTLSIIGRIGGFAGYFLGGTVDNTYDPEIILPGPIPVYVNGEVDLDDSNTEQWMYGLRFYVGAELMKKGKISFAPGIQFDLGLTDTSVDDVQPLPSKDTFWALTANVGVRYSVF